MSFSSTFEYRCKLHFCIIACTLIGIIIYANKCSNAINQLKPFVSNDINNYTQLTG